MTIKILTYLYLVLKYGALSKDLRIIGGVESDIVEAPYLVSLRLYDANGLKCAGAIISAQHILTAGHCVHEKEEFYPNLKIYGGTSFLCGECGSIYEIDKVFVHPDFDGAFLAKNDCHNDIAVIKIKETIEFSEFQKKIDLPTENFIEGSDAIVAGWGRTSFPSKTFSNVLRKIIVKTVGFEDCLKNFPYPVHKDQICTYSKGMSATVGDSGGPVVSNNKIIGVISYSVPGAMAPDIHINVYIHLNFIESIINS